MAQVSKIDSNVTGLSYAEEASLTILPGTPIWYPLEPNSYTDFGGEITTVARNPINPSRQRKKGVVTDLDASGGFNTDLTQTNLQDMLQGFFFASLRRKGEAKNAPGASTLLFAVDNATKLVTRSGTPTLDLTTQFSTDDLVYITGFANAANNGLFAVGNVTSTTIQLIAADYDQSAPSLVNESATAGVSITVVGQLPSEILTVDVSGSRPAFTHSGSLDFTTLGLIPGEWIFVGGDLANTAFTNAGNNGFARVRSITATRLEFDKTANTMVSETGTSIAPALFFGRILKNELGSNIVRRSYQLERTLGAPDDANLAQIQSEYLVGAIPNEFTINFATADKVTCDLSFVATDNQQRTGVQGIKPGTRISLVESDAFNTSSDVARIKLATVSANSNPSALFAFATDVTITINNNVTPNKAIGTLGAFDATAGTFQVSGNITAYFANVTAVQAVRNNSDITLDMHMVKANSGVSVDLPLISLGDGRANIEQDAPITLPLTNEAATGAKIDPNLDYTMLMVFWDYLPDLAS
jgi:hypothetical protein